MGILENYGVPAYDAPFAGKDSRATPENRFTAVARPNGVTESWSVWVLLLHAASACFMTGLIWFVQVVHYPLLGAVDPQGFGAYHREHLRRTTFVVGPIMLTEAATAVWIAGADRTSPFLAWLGLALLALVWTATTWLSVPKHNQLAAGFNADAHAALVATNWIRTVGWTARSVVSVVMAAGALGTP